jgi:4-hydroxy 2-oxovalerate aldolase
MKTNNAIHLDCTLRDGGYYNAWNFEIPLIEDYLVAMDSVGVSYVELGFRSFDKKSFQGPCAYTTDTFLETLNIPINLKLGVMMNASELIKHPLGVVDSLKSMFLPAPDSKVSLVRFACHGHEIEDILKGCTYLKKQGYVVGLNLMQISMMEETDVLKLSKMVNDNGDVDVFYFADSLGSMLPDDVVNVINLIKDGWDGPIGIHTHDNLGYGLNNTLKAFDNGATWLDSTVTGMGRGPGNAKTEYLAVELAERKNKDLNIGPLIVVINKYFKDLMQVYDWGTNPYYYLAGKYGIHPTYIQSMLSDSSYREEDILSVIESLREKNGNKFDKDNLMTGKSFYEGSPKGTFDALNTFEGRDVLIIGAGSGAYRHNLAIKSFIKKTDPIVIALNIETPIDDSMIDIRAACHPVRLFNDWRKHKDFNQPLLIPFSMIPKILSDDVKDKNIFDFGLSIKKDTFQFDENACIAPNSLAISYALCAVTSGSANKIYLAGFDGYDLDDPRGNEMNELLALYQSLDNSIEMVSITETKYKIKETSVYSF